MNIRSIRAIEIELHPDLKTKPRSESKKHSNILNRPLDSYPQFRKDRTGAPNWKRIACIVTAEDGTWGMGLTLYSAPVLPIINDHFATLLNGENCMAIEKLWDVMWPVVLLLSGVPYRLSQGGRKVSLVVILLLIV